MRISTGMIYDLSTATMQQRQQQLLKLQQQISTGTRILTPADDPVAAARVLNVKQSLALNAQYKANSGIAVAQLGIEDNALATATNFLQEAKSLAVYAGNGTLADSDRASIAAQLENDYQGLLGIANTSDGNGQYLFSGYKGATQPFSEAAPGNVNYAGDRGGREMQIGANRTIAIGDSGDTVFRAIKNGNGTFVAAAAGGNSGGGIVGPGTVTQPALWKSASNARDFTIVFDVTGGTTTYDIVDNVNNVSMLTGAAPGAGPFLRTFVSGDNIVLASQSPPDTNVTPFDYGATVKIDGAPANGDSFTVKASTQQDVFTTLHNLIAALANGNTGGTAAAASYTNAVNAALSDIDNALSNVLKVRASVGARLNEAANTQSSSDDVALQYNQTLSSLQDLDFTQAISNLSMQQTFLQAAQQSFIKVTGLTLFSMLS